MTRKRSTSNKPARDRSSEPSGGNRLPPRWLPKELHPCFKNGVIYLDVPIREKDDAKALGAKWDPKRKRWWIPADKKWRQFRQWLPLSELPRHSRPKHFPGKVARYYLSLLEQASPDEMGNNKLRFDGITFDELDAGRIRARSDAFQRFWRQAKELHDESPCPLEVDESASGDPDQAAGVFVAFGLEATRRADFRGVVLVLPALLARDGRLLAAVEMPPILNSAYYEPQDKPRSPILGSLDAWHDTMAQLTWRLGSSWPRTWKATNSLFASLNPEKVVLRDFASDQGRRLGIWLVPYERKDAMVRHLKALYNQLSSEGLDAAPLFSAMCDKKDPDPSLPHDKQQELGRQHTGHMSAVFGLDPSQREALRHLLATPAGRPLAVSGPPGTGKTACLQGIIATVLVNATLAREQPHPPIIIASAATNQAVTNIIKSFGTIADSSGEPTLGSRWLSPIQSYGWFLASRSAAQKAEFQNFQLLHRGHGDTWRYAGIAEDFSRSMEQHGSLGILAGEYQRAFCANFPRHADVAGVREAVRVLLAELKALAVGDGTSELTLGTATERIVRLVELVEDGGVHDGQDFVRRLERKARRDARIAERRRRLEAQVKTLSRRVQRIDTIRGKLDETLQRLRRRAIMGVAMLEAELAQAEKKLSRFEHRVEQICAAEIEWLSRAQLQAATIEEMLSLITYVGGLAAAFLPRNDVPAWTAGLRAGMDGQPFAPAVMAQPAYRLGTALATGGAEAAQTVHVLLEQLLDRTIRRHCFNLAARYWEGRWLLATEGAKGQQESLEDGLRRQCMLAPVIVATTYTLPALFAKSSSEFLLSTADLLIIDEAGQADPAAAMCLFALARQAVVVGDVEQLKPIWRVGPPQDLGFLRRADLAEQAWYLQQRGLRASSGSAMVAAQRASAFSAGDGRGITLIRHYRCRPTIIEFCNRLVYDSLRPLVPMTRKDPGRLYHPMAYVACNGLASRENGSVVNRDEAEELITWLADQRESIEAYYNRKSSSQLRPGDPGYRDIGDLVGIVAPFAGQSRYLTRLVDQAFPDASGESTESRSIVARMKLGTVHRLQGAERPLVLFSATNTPDDGGSPFMDANSDMLNVAISRAQDTFILFGHPGLFFSGRAQHPGNYAPSAVLGRYMVQYGKRLYPRRLVVVESPRKATYVQSALGRDCLAIATEGHIRSIADFDPQTLEVSWQVEQAKQPIISKLLELVADMDELVVATDDDREGDAIGWHVVDELRQQSSMDGVAISRMVFADMTNSAIQTAFARRQPWAHTGRAHAAVARAIIDRALGNTVSDMVNEQLAEDDAETRVGMGRVRTGLLRLIARHDTSDSEASESAWCVRARVSNGSERVSLWVTDSEALDAPARRFPDRDQAERAAQTIRAAASLRPGLAAEAFTLGPAAPVGTAEVLIAAHDRLGLRPGQVAQILQDLYEGNRRAIDVAATSEESDDE